MKTTAEKYFSFKEQFVILPPAVLSVRFTVTGSQQPHNDSVLCDVEILCFSGNMTSAFHNG